MQVQEVMSTNVETISANTTLKQAAEKMRSLDTGFLPISDQQQDKLLGVITDRDIAIRAVADGKNPENTTVQEAQTGKVLYCFQDEAVEKAAESMQKQQVYRLVVLNNAEEKQLCGVVSLGDIARHHDLQLVAKTARDIAA